jgi:hypothetical protein
MQRMPAVQRQRSGAVRLARGKQERVGGLRSGGVDHVAE